MSYWLVVVGHESVLRETTLYTFFITDNMRIWDMGAYISKDTTDYCAQASSIFSKVKTLFNDNDLKLPKSTSIEIRGQNKKKEYFILALF